MSKPDKHVSEETRTVGRDGREIVYPKGSIGTSPGHGIILIGMGDVAKNALRKSGIGLCVMRVT